MATQEEIRAVRENLPPEATANGWDDARISADLASGKSLAKIVQSWWRHRVANTADFVNISESGSSRSLDSVYKQAMEMLKYWDDRVAKEEEEQNNPQQGRGRIAFHQATRV